jgi:hypothetical protein
MNLLEQIRFDALQLETRRHFLRTCSTGMGAMWLALQGLGRAARASDTAVGKSAGAVTPHFPGRAKRVIFLHMAGAPSQLELFDYKPVLKELNGKDCPQEFLEGKRFAFLQGVPQLLGPVYPFHQAGESGQWISDRLPYFQRVVDHVCFVKSMSTDQFNHAPAQLLLHTGYANLGYPSLGAWATYGLGSENENLPGFIVLVSGGKTPDAGKSVWGAGYLPSVYQGVQCRSQGDPVLYLSNPSGISRPLRREALDTLDRINRETYQQLGDPETLTRIAQYELAFRMQLHATEAFDIKQEPAEVHQMYATRPGEEAFANNCLLARRLAERGVRFIQLFHWGWDSHGASASESLDHGFKDRCVEVDQPMAALLQDLDRLGLLEETLVVWSGEFGRTPMRENRGGTEMKLIGRDHNPGAFTLWMAGGGVKGGFSYGATDELGYQAAEGKMTPHDFHATALHLLGYDHRRLTYPFQGLNQRLSNVTKPSRVVEEVMA